MGAVGLFEHKGSRRARVGGVLRQQERKGKGSTRAKGVFGLREC